MKKFGFIITLLFVILIGFFSNAQTKNWYDSGNLHNKTMQQWHDATRENRLATSADFVSAMIVNKIFKYEVSSINGLKLYAIGIMNCADEAYTEKAPNLKVSEIAALCAVLLGYTK